MYKAPGICLRRLLQIKDVHKHSYPGAVSGFFLHVEHPPQQLAQYLWGLDYDDPHKKTSFPISPNGPAARPGTPFLILMLGRNEFVLRRGFAYGKTLVRRIRAVPSAMGPGPQARSGTPSSPAQASYRPPCRLRQGSLTPLRLLSPQKQGTLLRGPLFIRMLGWAKPTLRRGFAYGKTLVGCIRAVPSAMVPSR